MLAVLLLGLLAGRSGRAGDRRILEPEGRQDPVPDRSELRRRQGRRRRRQGKLQGPGRRRGIYRLARPARFLRRIDQSPRGEALVVLVLIFGGGGGYWGRRRGIW